jgi:predicted Zn-dependent protease
MIPNLDEIHKVLEEQLDHGATFSSIRCKSLVRERSLKWNDKKVHLNDRHHYNSWILQTLHSGTWTACSFPDFESLKINQSQSEKMIKEASVISGYPNHAKDTLHPKAVRQIRHPDFEGEALPTAEKCLVEIKHVSDFFDHPINAHYRDRLIKSHYWDSEHSRGASEYVNQDLTIHYSGQKQDHQIQLHHVYALPLNKEENSLQEFHWGKDLRRWAKTLSEESFNGPSPEDFCWIFSNRAFAQLIQGTLAPTLCLQRPDPFLDSMNPASLNDTAITSPYLTLSSQPSLFCESSFLDEEGVPARQLPLIEDGLLKNFIMTRSSANHLSRSLPVHKEKICAGSSRVSSFDLQFYPDLKHIRVETGASLEKDFRLSHLFINDIQVFPLDDIEQTFLIIANNVLVNKFGGMHKRHIRRLRFLVTREQLWTKLLGVGQDSLLVSLPTPHATYEEPYSLFSVPMAKFRGCPCTWS